MGVVIINLAVLACMLKTTTKKVVNFFKEKSSPQKKILATPMLIATSFILRVRFRERLITN